MTDGKDKIESKENLGNKPINEYSIYDYLKEHPSIFFAFFSAVVAAISVMLNFLVYLATTGYLSYFEVQTNVHIVSANFLYFFAIGLAFYIVQSLSQRFISSTFEAYRPYKQRFMLHKYALKNIKEEWKYGRNIRKQLYIELKKVNITDDNRDEISSIEQSHSQIKEKEHQIFADYCDVKRDIRKQRLFYYSLIGISCLFSWLAMFFVFYMLLSVSATSLNPSILFCSLLTLVYVFLFALENWFLSCVLHINRKQIKKDAIADKENRVLSYDDFPPTPLETIVLGNIRSTLSNSNITRCLGTILLSIILLSFVSSWGAHKSAENQKEFFVVNEGDIVYAVIYNDGQKMVLEKAEITENQLIINTTEQKIIDAIGIPTKKYTFENVFLNRIEVVNHNDSSDEKRDNSNYKSDENTIGERNNSDIRESLYHNIETQNVPTLEGDHP